MLSVPKDPIPLRHFGLAETKAKVDLMEDEYDRPMLFEPDLVPDPAVAGESVGAWGQGVDVFGAARGYKHSRTMPTLLASMLGFGVRGGDGGYEAVPPRTWRLSVRAGRLPTHSFFNVFYCLLTHSVLYIISMTTHCFSSMVDNRTIHCYSYLTYDPL